jgi:serine/threonine-protein kinase
MIGRTLARTYQIERLLGGGGMGAVYAAKHVRTGGIFAVKLLHRETATDAEIYKRFQDEARTISALRHPHIVQVTDFDRDDDGTPFIVMELLEGEDLYQRLCRVGKLPLEPVLDIGRQVGSALHAAHEKGIIHRDVKPQNIFLVRHDIADVVSEVAKVVDFGISKIRRTGAGAQMTRDMTILGTPQFMSPEAALGQNSQLDGRADQWSLAVIMYLALAGQLPFDGENLVGVLYMVVHEQPTPLKQLAPEVPDHLVDAIARAMSKKKEERFPRMADFVRAIIAQAPGGAMRITSGMQMNSAVFRVPTQIDPRLQSPTPAEAPTAVPHLRTSSPSPPQSNPPPAGLPPPPSTPRPLAQPPPRLPPIIAQGPTAATLAPPIPGHPEMEPTRPRITGELPLTVPASHPPPNLVSAPSSPTAFNPMIPRPTQVVGKPLPQSGDTPTNITLDPAAVKNLIASEAASAANKSDDSIDGGDSAATPQEQPLSEEELENRAAHDGATKVAVRPAADSGVVIDPEIDGIDSPEDLQSIPTRVASFPGYSSPSDPTVASADSIKSTLPLTSLRRMPQGSPVDTAYPSTLSRAAGQPDVSLRPRGMLGFLKDIDWARQRERGLALIGVAPRSPQRLGIAAGLATLLLSSLVLFVALGAKAHDRDHDKGLSVATGQPTEDQKGPGPGLGPGKDNPTHPVAVPDGSDSNNLAGPSGSASADEAGGKGQTPLGNGQTQTSQVKKGKPGPSSSASTKKAGKPKNKLRLF